MIVFLCIHAETVLHSFGGMDIEESEPVAEDFLCVSVLNEPDKDSLSNQISLSFFKSIMQISFSFFPATALLKTVKLPS